MSVNYAAGLSNFPHIHKGNLGLPEIFDSPDVLQKGIDQLVHLIKQSKYMVVHTGAGISTSAGIPDFRGPNGVWTLEAKGKSPKVSIDFDEAVPTKTHMSILALKQHGIVKYVVSQNIDGLHLRSGLPRSHLSELHGNMFVEKCEKCQHEYYRCTPVKTMKEQRTGNLCQQKGKRGLSNCRGKLRDTILDWEASLPPNDLSRAENETKKSDLSLCLGTTLQIVPSGKIPLLTIKNNGKIVIVNLQKTKYDKKASLLIHSYVDDVMQGVMKGLGLDIPEYNINLYLGIVTYFPDDNISKIKSQNSNESKGKLIVYAIEKVKDDPDEKNLTLNYPKVENNEEIAVKKVKNFKTRHRCLHYIPSRLRKQQTQPCILTTEYSEEYMKSSPNARQTITRPSDHLRPGGEHDHTTTTHETYLPHQVKGRVLIRVKDQIETPSEEMQKDSEYKLKYKVNGRGETAHYQRNRKTQLYDSNGEPIDQSVMKNDYVPRKNWVKPVKHGPKDNLNAVATPFDSRTTNQEDFTHHKDVQKSRVIRRSDDALKSNDPFDGDTTNSATYKKWNVPRQKSGRPLSSLRPRSGKVDYHTTTDSYFQFGEKNERTKTARPKSNLGRKDGQFESDTTYSKNYLPHSMAGRAMRHKTAKWESPKVPFDSTTETTENYRAHTAQPLRFSKRQSNLRSDEAPFDSTSLYTDEYGYKKLPDCQSAKIVNSNFDGYKIYDDFNSGHRFLAKIEQTEQDINKINIGGGSAPLPPISSQDF